jgi:hypothetical protein
MGTSKGTKLRCVVALFGVLSGGVLAEGGKTNGICGAKTDSSAVGRSVSFHGTVSSNGVDSTVIRPAECPHEAYVLLGPKDKQDPTTLIFDAVYSVGAPGTMDKRIDVDIGAEIVKVSDTRVGVKVTKVDGLVLSYPSQRWDPGSQSLVHPAHPAN